MMLNTITLQGRLTDEPQLKTTSNNIAVTTFTLAVNRDYDREQTDFFSCVAWRNTAEFINKYFRKGQLAVVHGRMQSRKWTDKEGKNRINWDVQVDNIYFCESKKDSGEGYSAGEPEYTPPKAPEVVADDDGELPF